MVSFFTSGSTEKHPPFLVFSKQISGLSYFVKALAIRLSDVMVYLFPFWLVGSEIKCT